MPIASTNPKKPRFDFDNAGDIDQKIRDTQGAIDRAKQNYDLFLQKANEQLPLKVALQDELNRLQRIKGQTPPKK